MKSTQKKGDPAVCDPCAALRGHLGCSVVGCAVELTALLRSSARTTTASQLTKQVCPAAHLPPHTLRAPGASTRGWAAEQPPGPLLRSARGRPRCARRGAQLHSAGQRNARNPAPGAAAKQQPCGTRPSGSLQDAPRSAAPGGKRAARCLSAASLRGPRLARAPQVARSEAQGRSVQGRLFFGGFLLAKQQKATVPPGAHPGPRPSSKQPPTIKTVAANNLHIRSKRP